MLRRVLIIGSLVILLAACGIPDEEGLGRRGPVSSDTTAGTDGAATPQPAIACSFTSVLIAKIESVTDLTWASEHIVIGTIAERLPLTPDPNAPQQPLYTDYVVKVEKNLRGTPLPTLRIRQPGGSIPGGCTDLQGELQLHVGDRFLLFLREPRSNTAVPTFRVAGHRQGYWRLSDSNVIIDPSHFQQFSGKSIADLAVQVSSILSIPQPPGQLTGNYNAIPLNAAPLGIDLHALASPRP